MKKNLLLMALLAMLCTPVQAQSFLEKMKQKAEQAVGGNLGNVLGIPDEVGNDDASVMPGTDRGSQAVTGEQALPAKRASTFGWDGPVTPSSAKFPIPLFNEFPALPSAQDLVNPVEEKQIAYYKAIKAVTLRAEELNTDTTCEDSETLLWRKKTNDGLKSAFGLTDEEVAILTADNPSEADLKRVEEKIEKSIVGGLDVDAMEAEAAKMDSMSEEELMASLGNNTLSAQAAVYDRNASNIIKYMGVTAAELKQAAAEQMNSGNPDKPTAKMTALQKKSEAYQKAEAAKNPSFKKEADAFQAKLQGELRDASKKASRSMMGGMGSAMEMMDQMNKKTAPLMEMQTKLSKYMMDVTELNQVGVESSADVSFAASERKKVLALKTKIYQTRDASVYNPLYLEALEMIKSYRERAAAVWLSDLQKRIAARKEALPKMVKLNRQAIEDELVPECALYREPLNMVIVTGDILAEAYSEFPSDYPHMWNEEVVREVKIPGNRGIWWPEFAVFGQSDFDAIVSGKHIYSMDQDGKVYHFVSGSWVAVSADEFQKLNGKKKEAGAPVSASWTSSDGKRTVFYNAEGGFLQLPEGDQVFPTCLKKDGNVLQWVRTYDDQTPDGLKYKVVLCTYKL